MKLKERDKSLLEYGQRDRDGETGVGERGCRCGRETERQEYVRERRYRKGRERDRETGV